MITGVKVLGSILVMVGGLVPLITVWVYLYLVELMRLVLLRHYSEQKHLLNYHLSYLYYSPACQIPKKSSIVCLIFLFSYNCLLYCDRYAHYSYRLVCGSYSPFFTAIQYCVVNTLFYNIY